jgi:hypothetical protein
MTYREAFEAALRERIAGGGAVDEMVAVVNAYQGADRTTREHLFQEWLRDAPQNCGRCKGAFHPRGDHVVEEDEVVCDWCTHGYLGASWNPMRSAVRWR